jgi:protein phosphatase
LTTPHRDLDVLDSHSNTLELERCRFSAASLVGPNHHINQDSYVCNAPDFFGVADGVGGGALGEVASAMLIKALGELKQPTTTEVDNVLKATDRAISHRLIQEGQGQGAAVCAAVWRQKERKDGWLVMTVGDCKVMMASLRNSAWSICWSSTVQSYEHLGLPPPSGVSKESPANMVGCGMQHPAHFYTIKPNANDIVILCSDGFDNVSNEEEILELLNKTDLPLNSRTAQYWCEKAQELGTRDDVTVILVQTETSSPHNWLAIGWSLILISVLIGLLLWGYL